MKQLSKNQLIIQPKTIFLITALAVVVFFALVPSADAQQVIAPGCEKTRLGCLDKNPPFVPVDQPVLIQAGLQVNIKCEAKSSEGKAYELDLHLVKKIQVQQDQTLNYYLVPGNHGELNFQISEAGASEVQQYIVGEFVFHSEIATAPEGQNLLIKAVDHRTTRVGAITTTTELAFSPSEQGQPLKIFSASQQTVQVSFFDQEPKTSSETLTFSYSNCVYY